MINPNKVYSSKFLATIVKLDSPTSYIPYVTILTDDGRTLEGSLTRCNSQWRKFKVGDRVGYGVQWSIMGDKPMIRTLIKKRIPV